MAPPAGKASQKSANPIETLRKFWEKDRKLIIQQALIVGAIVAVAVFAFCPLLVKTHLLNSRMKDLGLQIVSAQSKIKKMPDWKKQMENYRKEIDLLEKRVFKIQEIDQLVGDLSKSAADSGVRLVGSRPLNEKPQVLPDPFNKKYLFVSYELTLEGGYHELGRLLSNVEQSERLLLIRDANLQPGTGKQSEKLQCTLQVDALVQAPQGIP